MNTTINIEDGTKYEGIIFSKEGKFYTGKIDVKDGVIETIDYENDVTSFVLECIKNDKKIDLIIPGLIDMHMHGAKGLDICDGSKIGIDGYEKIAAYEESEGIVAFCGATMTVPIEDIKDVLLVLSNSGSSKLTKNLKGIYLEGPYISKEYCGAQRKECVKKFTSKELKELLDIYKDIKAVVVAPEELNRIEDIKEITSKNIICSIGHTAADYDIAMNAFHMTASQVTHLYNGMKDCGKRNPNIPGAAFDAKAYVELIADGNHIDNTMLRMAFQIYDEDKIILISDSMRGTGLSNGVYTLGGQKVHVIGNEARLLDGTLAGSVMNLKECLRNAIKNGVPIVKAIKAATINPARRLGIDDFYGTIEVGKCHPIILKNI